MASHKFKTDDRPPAGLLCRHCGRLNALNAPRCLDCNEAFQEASEPPQPSSTRQAPRARRKPSLLPSAAFFAGLLRLGALAFLFYDLFDGGNWLANVTAGLAPSDPAALRYDVYAVYETLRDMALVGGIWLLTAMVAPRRTPS
jgi:hypothetical protein